MPNYTTNFKLKQPFPTENYNVEDQNGNMEIIDSIFEAHKAAATLDHPDNSVTDAKIGERTIDQKQTPVNTGLLSVLIGGIANIIAKITGKPDWKTPPRTTLENAVKRDGDRMTGQLEINNTAPRFLLQDSTPNAKGVAFVNDLDKLFVQQTDGTGAKVADRFSLDLTTGEGFLGEANKQILHTENYAKFINRLGAPADTRKENILPGAYPQGISNEFKLLSAIGIKAGTQYGFLVTYKPWTDDSGGPTQQMCFAEDTTCPIWHRSGTSSGGWGIWKPVGMNKLRYSTKGAADFNGKYPNVDYLRNDGSVYASLAHSNPDANGNYRTVITTYYGPDGKTSLGTERVDRTFDENGIMTSEV